MKNISLKHMVEMAWPNHKNVQVVKLVENSIKGHVEAQVC